MASGSVTLSEQLKGPATRIGPSPAAAQLTDPCGTRILGAIAIRMAGDVSNRLGECHYLFFGFIVLGPMAAGLILSTKLTQPVKGVCPRFRGRRSHGISAGKSMERV